MGIKPAQSELNAALRPIFGHIQNKDELNFFICMLQSSSDFIPNFAKSGTIADIIKQESFQLDTDESKNI